jgi:uncharacterized protein
MNYKPDICIYHAHCMDGFGAAWAIWKKYGDACEYVPAQHGEPLPNMHGKNVIMVDFSVKRDAILELMDPNGGGVKSLIILDHHKTAEAELKEFIFGDGEYSLSAHGLARALSNGDLFSITQAAKRLPVIAVFNMHRSGARLAWEFANGLEAAPELIAHIEDRDLWRFALTGTLEVHAALKTLPLDFEVWDNLSKSIPELIVQGKMLLRSEKMSIERMIKNAYKMKLCGYYVPTLNTNTLISEAAHELLKSNPDAPFSVSWWTDGMWAYASLRSEDSRVDVSEIAREFGGGGHRNASGFKINFQDWPGAALS